MAKIKQGPHFIRYFDPVIKALKELGGSGTPSEVVEIVARLKSVSEEEQKETVKTGASRFVVKSGKGRTPNPVNLEHLIRKRSNT